jgi:hypothetical protein
MDIQAITTTIVPIAQPASPAPTAAPDLQDPTVPTTATPAFDVTLLTASAPQAAVEVDPQTEDLAALAEQALVAQQTVLSAMRSGVTDVSTLLSGLPPGATATLLGGGWSRVPPGASAEESGTVWSFLLPLRRENVPAVTTSAKAGATREKDQGGARGSAPLASYGPHGEKDSLPGLPGTSTVDILD